jgi:serine protease
LDADGGGSLFAVLAGLDWSVNDMVSRGKKGKSVANMSLQSNRLLSQNDAVNAAVSAGLPIIAAAGNDSGDACGYSPASAEDAYTAVASDESDTISHFSNWGQCTSIIAPGSLITAAWIGNTTATRTISGTSMAAPHVAGVAAKILSRAAEGATPQALYAELTETASEGKIVGIPDTHGKTPNLLVYKPCNGPAVPTPGPPPPTPTTPTPAPAAPTPAPATPTPAPACASIPPQNRKLCGGEYFGNEVQCKAAFGGRCCWEQGGSTNVWCYDDTER